MLGTTRAKGGVVAESRSLNREVYGIDAVRVISSEIDDRVVVDLVELGSLGVPITLVFGRVISVEKQFEVSSPFDTCRV